MKYIFTALFSLLISVCALAQNGQDEVYAEATLSSDQLIPGESATLELRIRGGRADSRPATPNIPNTALNFAGTQTQIINMTEIISVFSYRLTPAKAGKYTIPSMAMSSGGKILETAPINFQVSDPKSLQAVSTGIEGYDTLIKWLPNKEELYPGEQTEVSLKLYLPQQLNVVNLGVLEPTKNNCLVWRFAPTSQSNGRVMINGEPYITETLSSTLSGISPGKASLKESHLEVTIRQRVSRSRIQDIPLDLTIPDLNLNVIPFPSGAPSDFKGAVGNFQIGNHCEKPSFNSNEPTEVLLQIAGTGNLESLKAPNIGISENTGLGWKVINTSKIARGEERRELSGAVTFRQLIRPLIKNKTALQQGQLSIPSYSFSFFNPDSKTYHTLKTQPIPVNITLSDDPVTENEESEPTAEIKSEKMTDILEFIEQPNEQKKLRAPHTALSLLWHIIPASLCLIILSIPLQKKLYHRFAKSPEQKEKQKDFRLLSQEPVAEKFYTQAGRYIDRWIHNHDAPELKTIITERDELCYQSQSTSDAPIQQSRKNEILSLLKKLSTVIIFISCLFNSKPLSAKEFTTADTAYKAQKYQQAIDLYLKTNPSADKDIYNTSADTFYNLGNCYFKLKQSGYAALMWRRALAVDPTHKLAAKNLAFTEKEELSMSPSYQDWQNKLRKISPLLLLLSSEISLWIFILSLLIMICLRAKPWVKRNQPLLITLTVLTPCIAAVGFFAYYFHPHSNHRIDHTEQAVTLSKVSLYPQAHRDPDNRQIITPASLVRVIGTRGAWTNVQLTDQTNIENPVEGWVQTESIKRLTTH